MHTEHTMPVDLRKVKPVLRGADALSALSGKNPDGTFGHAITAEDKLAAWLVTGPIRTTALTDLRAVLFDLDGVLVDTAEFHYQAWQRLADELGLAFDRKKNEAFRGVGRMECMDRLLGRHGHAFGPEERTLLADHKNAFYLDLVKKLSPKDIAPGALTLIMQLRAGGVRLAVVSASKNARLVLDRLEITQYFDAIVDGHSVVRGKPHPEGFLLAAGKVAIKPEHCVVIEDAEAGIIAGRNAGMRTLAITDSASPIRELADGAATGLAEVSFDALVLLPSGGNPPRGINSAA